MKLVVSSPELLAPEKLVLNFEEHGLDFEYEVKVGKRGDYSIRLTPEVGEPVVVSVSLR